MRFARLSLVSLLAVVASQLAPVAAAHAVNGPAATITSPSAGANLAGIVTVTGTGSIDPAASDTTQSLQLFVNGAAVGSPQTCPQTDPNNCTLSFNNDFTDVAAQSYVLNLKFVTASTGAAGVMSPDVAINVSSPAPTASVTSPGNGATVQGSTTIATSGVVDSSQTNTATSLQLMVDGATVGTAYTCPGSVRTCSHSFTFDFTGGTTGRTLGVRFISTAKPSGTHTIDSAGVSVNVDSPAPTTAISSPSAGAQVTGNVGVTASGTVDSTQTDSASTMQLYVDGSAYGTPTTCPTSSGAKSCPITLNWDATGQPAGSYSLKTQFVTATGRSVFSATVAVNLLVPAPTVTISSPANNGSVSGVTPVNATGTVDPTLSDYAASLMLTVDGTDQTPVSCPGTSHTCSLALPWDASGLIGSHTLVVTLLTHNGVVATRTITVTASTNPPTATVLSPTFGSAASGVVSISAKGTIAASQTDSAVSLQLLVDGQPKGSPTPCTGGDPKQCPMTFSYDFSGLTGTHQVSLRFVTATTTVTSPVVGLVISSPAPAVSVTSPVASSTVAGMVSVGLSGTVNPGQTDSGVSLQLLVDGVATGSPTTCPAGGDPKACAVSVPWNATGLSGTHVLQAVFASAKVAATTSAGVTVTVSNPAPSATIVTPTAGATVSGVVTVTFSGAVNAALTDTAKSAFVALDGVVRGTQVACPASSDLRACATSFSVNTVGLAGPHTLTVTFLTTLGQQVVASEKIFVFSSTKTTLGAIAPVTAGHTASVKGTVEDIGTGFGLAGQPVQVTFTPAAGKKHTVVVHTDGRGHFATAYKLTVNTVVRAVLAGPAYYGVSSASRKIAVTAAVSCAKASAKHGAALVGTCKAVGLAKGVKLALQVKVGSHWVALGKATAGAGTVSYAARFATAGTYAVRVVVVAGKIFAAGSGAAFSVAVS
ncbi:Ig-like domain-containing protein [Acidothermaceae bacterium B102]|nr:Ig-like domain-containing protein [Acidothermaceae bacterium B102]